MSLSARDSSTREIASSRACSVQACGHSPAGRPQGAYPLRCLTGGSPQAGCGRAARRHGCGSANCGHGGPGTGALRLVASASRCAQDGCHVTPASSCTAQKPALRYGRTPLLSKASPHSNKSQQAPGVARLPGIEIVPTGRRPATGQLDAVAVKVLHEELHHVPSAATVSTTLLRKGARS